MKTVKIPSKKIDGKVYHLLDSASNEEQAKNKATIFTGTGRFSEVVIKEFTVKGVKKVGIWGRMPHEK